MKRESIVCCDGTMKNKSVKYGIRIQKQKRLPNYLLGECPSRFVYDVSKRALGTGYNK